MDRHCLIVADDPDVLDALLRLAAAADLDALRAVDAADARRAWARAPVVLLDRAGAARCRDAGFPRRDTVVIAVTGEPAAEDWRTAVALGADRVVQLPHGEAGLTGLLADARERAAAGGRPGRVLAVVGGSGGAGASVLATAVAVTAARTGAAALLVDCDPLGGGLDLLVGLEQEAGLRWPELAVGDGRVRAAALHAALPRTVSGRSDLSVLSCARSPHGPGPAAVGAVLDAGRRGGGTVVCDLPRYPTDAALAALGAADLTVLVVPAALRAGAAAARVADVLAEHARVVEVVVRGPSPGGITPDEVATSLGLPLLHAMRAERDLPGALERGRTPGAGRGALATAARAVLERLSAVGHEKAAAS
ncbi:Septum site-determining protein MinD, possible CpaE [Pseudonocardia sp. Ae168_Ps1]|uniref:septum site-determining protein Ssd n=1 Tax=unclassified Pseudonocardia TaxID=2619320 RepID=UPI00094AFDA2|nr:MULTISPECIES: septum site-determining protein Ssd [unclassified Pseudonocardia]OLL75282.1 Septum site-determining protein MinD possible CpaE [Pseudonocardia sp. Ae150A_Ps1]OLL81277.1 Septum site-determining protein MinD, possible CpaE [Pseudonocardia sp. Ae168_Ps1]OLL84609.1 Septum site-determining protein MinD, possible CpaE [Pseudonocardia sp. Ae263_Ps1]OLL95372.1 Septum site-determining protein MinD, possible CpaE [Pseudonocardia sp. Ae356_Ps1]